MTTTPPQVPAHMAWLAALRQAELVLGWGLKVPAPQAP